METLENTLIGCPRAKGLLAMAHPMEPSPVQQPQDCMGMPRPSATTLRQEPTLSNDPQQPLLSQHRMASLLSVELDSSTFFLEQDKIVPCPITDLWQTNPTAIDPVLCPSISSKLVIHSGNSLDVFFHRHHDRTEESTPCFTASGSSHILRNHLPQVVPDLPVNCCPPKEHTNIDSVSEQVFQLQVTGHFTVCWPELPRRWEISPQSQIHEIDRDLTTTQPAPTCLGATADPCNVTWSALSIPLMEHQKEGLMWMMAREGSDWKGSILADDMGLGKTIQALALTVIHPAPSVKQHATLVVMPAGLISQWKHKIEQLLNQGHPCWVFVYHGDKMGRTGTFHLLNQHDIVLTTFGMVAAELRWMCHWPSACSTVPSDPGLSILGPVSKWHWVILDEAQCIKNDRSKTAMACCTINTTYCWCLSGTPLMNDPRELTSLFKFLWVQGFCNAKPFNPVSLPSGNPTPDIHCPWFFLSGSGHLQPTGGHLDLSWLKDQVFHHTLHGSHTHNQNRNTMQLQDLVKMVMLHQTKTSTLHS